MQLRAHQVKAVNFALSRPASLIAAGMGTGKSCIALTANDAWQTRRMLVVCPTTVRPVWRREIAKHAQRDIQAVVLDEGTVAERTAQAADALKSDRPTIIVTNYEAASLHEPMRSWILSQSWDLAVLDESHRAMGLSKTAQFCNELRATARHRMCLSGTPLTQDPISVWAQCRYLEPYVFGHNLEWFKDHFWNKYALSYRKALARANKLLARRGIAPIRFSENLGRGTINTEIYLRRLATIAIRIESDVLDLPPLTVEQRTFKLSREARKLYDALEGGYWRVIQHGRWPWVQFSYAKTMRLQQLTSGWLPDKEKNPVSVDTGKRECLRDILVEAGGEPVVVFCRFSHDLSVTEELAGELGLSYAEISQYRKDGMDSMGLMPGWCQVVGVQEQAGGAGIDLSRSRIAVDYSPSWSLPNSDQKLARLHRPPQARPVVVYRLVAENTIDEEIHLAVSARRGMVSQVWTELQRRPAHATASR